MTNFVILACYDAFKVNRTLTIAYRKPQIKILKNGGRVNAKNRV